MRRWRPAVLACLMALFLVAATATPGAATPKPLPTEWWFTTWGVTSKVWPLSTGQGVTVALLDSGVEAALPDLSGVVLPGKNFDTGADDGRVDTDTGPGHGTNMASLIASQGTGTGFVGVAPDAKILPLTAHNGDAVITAIHYAADHGAKVINISEGAGAPCPDPIQDAINDALQRDVVVVASSGDSGDGTNAAEEPGDCAGVLTVGAVGPRSQPWAKTQRQPYVAVAAPGSLVGGLLRDGSVYSNGQGASQATALTSAAVALVRSRFPNLSARQVVQQIIGSAADVGPPGKDDQTGYGLIQPARILDGSVPKNGPNPVFDSYDRWVAAHLPQAPPAHADSSPTHSAPWTLIAAISGVLLLAALAVLAAKTMRRRPRAAADRARPYSPSTYEPPFRGDPHARGQ